MIVGERQKPLYDTFTIPVTVYVGFLRLDRNGLACVPQRFVIR